MRMTDTDYEFLTVKVGDSIIEDVVYISLPSPDKPYTIIHIDNEVTNDIIVTTDKVYIYARQV